MAAKVNVIDKECDLVIIGKSAAGKSSLGNSLLCGTSGKKAFKAKPSRSAVTTQCQRKRATLDDGTLLTIVDTPGLFDTVSPNEDILKEIVKCISLCAPGPHVIVFVLSLKRFTKEEVETVRILKEVFGTEAMKHFIVVFTWKDDLYDDDDEDDEDDVKKIDDFIEQSYVYLKNFLKECNMRYVGIANKPSSPTHYSDVKDVMKLIYKTMEENDNQVYSQEAFAKAEQLIKEEEERRKRALEEEKRKKWRQEEEKIEKEKQKLKEKEDEERRKLKLSDEEIRRRERMLEDRLRQLKQEAADEITRRLDEMVRQFSRIRDEIIKK